MGKDKYSAIQKRLGALDLNDDILRDEYDILLKNFNEILKKHRYMEKELSLLKVKNSRLTRENKSLKVSLHNETSYKNRDTNYLSKREITRDIVGMFSGKKNSRKSSENIIDALSNRNKLLSNKALRSSMFAYNKLNNGREEK